MRTKFFFLMLLPLCACQTRLKAQFILVATHGDALPRRFFTSTTLPKMQAIHRSGPGVLSSIDIAEGTELRVLRTIGNVYEVRVLSTNATYRAASDATTNSILLVDRSTIDAQRGNGSATVTWSYGGFSFPFKWRPQAHYFEPNFQLSGAAGPCFRLTADDTRSLSFYGSIGYSTVNVDSTNSDPVAGIRSVTGKSAATAALTTLFQADKAQISLSIGWDALFDNRDIKWRYDGVPWFTIGVGYNVFAKQP